MSKAKYQYHWMSFGQSDGKLLQAYLNMQAEKGYAISKISRFYLRFKKVDEYVGPYYVEPYRNHYFSHLYWHIGHEPFEKKAMISRKVLNLGLLMISGLAFLLSLFFIYQYAYLAMYDDALSAVLLLLPLFSLSFVFDNLGRFLECVRKHKKTLGYARMRAWLLSLNLFFRYGLLFFIIAPAILKSMELMVVFIILLFLGYEVLYYYLPHRHKLILLAFSALFSLASCEMVNFLVTHQRYIKEDIVYYELPVLEASDFKEIVEPFKRQIHRRANTSILVPFSYTRDEVKTSLKEENSFEVYTQLTRCKNSYISDYIFKHLLGKYDHVKEIPNDRMMVYLCDDSYLLFKYEDDIGCFYCSLDEDILAMALKHMNAFHHGFE